MNNPSFELGWEDVQSSPSTLNQIPKHWGLRWLTPGQPLWDSNDVANGVPECRHLHITHLPPDEQPGGPNALILDGEWTYKIFHAQSAFGAQLTQEIYGLVPGSPAFVQMHCIIDRHGDGDIWAAECGLWANGVGLWHQPKHRVWKRMEVQCAADQVGRVVVTVRVKSKWNKPKDFFLDNGFFSGVPIGPIEPTEREPFITIFDDGTWDYADVS